MYEGVDILLATKHKKEQAIQKPFEDTFRAKIVVPDDYDTDQLGTFTGEIPRQETAYNTVIKKANDALLKYGYHYAIANEGSFGPHPYIYFAPGDMELMVFVDLEANLVIGEIEISTATNYGHIDITDKECRYQDFLEKAKFPSHGLIVRTLDGEKHFIEKRDLSATTTQNSHRQSISIQ